MSREIVLNFGGMSIDMSFDSYGSLRLMLLRVFSGFRGSFMEIQRVLEITKGLWGFSRNPGISY